jgi:hypothetical protein
MTADLPWDVHAFRAQDAAFPHHSTADQLFTDQKFEAYRVLGFHAAGRAMKAMDVKDVRAQSRRATRSGQAQRVSLGGGWA